MNRYFSISILLLAGISIHPSLAQTENKSEETSNYTGFYAYGGIGPAIPVGQYGSERSVGFDLNTAMEYRFNSGFLARGMFDFASFEFERGTISQLSNGQEYAIAGSNNVISLLLSGGYYVPLGRFSPYAFAGAGISILSKPGVDIDEDYNTIDTSLLINTYFSTITGVGIDFVLNPPKENEQQTTKSLFILYAESFFTYIPQVTATSASTFSVLTFNIGIKNKF